MEDSKQTAVSSRQHIGTNRSTPIEKAWLRLRLTERRSEQIETLKRQRLEIQSLKTVIDRQRIDLLIDRQRIDLLDGTESLYKATFKYEGELIAAALAATPGKAQLTRAAALLGISHQALGYSISRRHKELLPLRTRRLTRSKQ